MQKQWGEKDNVKAWDKGGGVANVPAACSPGHFC